MNLMTWLGKEAAKVSRRSRLVKGEEAQQEALKESPGNSQPPHRYGRKVRKKS